MLHQGKQSKDTACPNGMIGREELFLIFLEINFVTDADTRFLQLKRGRIAYKFSFGEICLSWQADIQHREFLKKFAMTSGTQMSGYASPQLRDILDRNFMHRAVLRTGRARLGCSAIWVQDVPELGSETPKRQLENDNSHETTQNLMLIGEFLTCHFTAVGSDLL